MNQPVLTAEQILRLCDHAVLHPTMTDEQMRAELVAVRGLPLATVCIKPYAVPLACEVLSGTTIGVGTVVGFPHGSAVPEAKAAEAERAMADGAVELDMVINVGKALARDRAYLERDVGAVLAVARRRKGTVVKVIFETDYLTDTTAKVELCRICTDLGVDFVKTSTGFGFAKQPDGRFLALGAQDADLRLMREHSGPAVGVKASGGVRTLADARRVIALGATRIGTSSSQAIFDAASAAKGGQPDTGY